MGSNSLTNKVAGNTIFSTDVNELQTALNGDFVGRNSSGSPTASQNLGTAAVPWGAIRGSSLILGGSSVDTSQVAAPPFRVVSGATRSTSNQPLYLTPEGSAATLNIKGGTTSLVYDVNGSAVTLSANLQSTGLTVAPSTNNTALVNDTDAADGDATRLWGEENPFAQKKVITIDTVGSQITALNGKLAAFKLSTEVFLARVDTSNNRLHKCERGIFFDSSDAPLKRETLANNDTITLMSLGFVFLEDDASTIDVSYTEPTYSFTAPSPAATGDYWFDMGNSLWKRYDGVTFQTVDRTLVGMVVIDSSNCIAARSEPFDKTFKSDNEMLLEIQSTEIIRAKRRNARTNVAGTEIDFGKSQPTWNITTNLATAADMYNSSEQASTYYGLYLKNTGETVMSDIEPRVRSDAKGLYHPQNDDWRFVGEAFNDSSSDITRLSDEVEKISEVWVHTQSGFGSTATRNPIFSNVQNKEGTQVSHTTSAGDGDKFTIRRDGTYCMQFDFNATNDAATLDIGIGLDTDGTADPSAMAVSERLCRAVGGASGSPAEFESVSISKKLPAGAVLRPHVEAGSTPAVTAGCQMRINKVK